MLHGSNVVSIENENVEVTGSRYIFEEVYKQGVEHIFMLPGKSIQPCMRALTDVDNILPIVTTHETSAGYMADAYARVTGNIGVVLAISSPGAMNLVPALAAAHADGIPVLAISGDIHTYNEAKGAFQDGSSSGNSDVSACKGITSLSARVSHIDSLPNYLNIAFERLSLPSKSPAFLQIPLDIQTDGIQRQQKANKSVVDYSINPNLEQVEHVLTTLLKPRSKNIFILGPEVRNTQLSSAIVQIAERLNIPVATTLDSKGSFPEDHPLSLGVFGFAGNKRAMETVLELEPDNIISFGVNFDQRATLSWAKHIAEESNWISISAKAGSFYHHKSCDYLIMSSPDRFAEQLLSLDKSKLRSSNVGNNQWLETITSIPFHLEEVFDRKEGSIHPAEAILALRERIPRDAIVSVDSGSHRVFSAHYWKSYAPNTYLTSASTAPMGWAICAGISAKLARPECTSVVITGDGCMLMHGNEIQTASKYSIPVIFVVINNSVHGGIHAEYQKGDNFDPEMTALSKINWKNYAESLGLIGFRVNREEDLSKVFKAALNSGKPCLIDVICRDDAIVPNLYSFQ